MRKWGLGILTTASAVAISVANLLAHGPGAAPIAAEPVSFELSMASVPAVHRLPLVELHQDAELWNSDRWAAETPVPPTAGPGGTGSEVLGSDVLRPVPESQPFPGGLNSSAESMPELNQGAVEYVVPMQDPAHVDVESSMGSAPPGWLVQAAANPPTAKQHMVGFELHRDASTWLVGNGDDFGYFSLEGVSTVNLGRLDGWFSGYSVHFVGGPIQTDMPPRLFELYTGYRFMGDLSPRWGYDLTISTGIYTDFEGHAHQGWRIRGVGVTKVRLSRSTTAVVGVAYLDRENLDMLPVAGLVIELSPFTTLELMFPEPRLSTSFSFGAAGQSEVYVRGQLGGGSWAIERDSLASDIATYEDFRAFVGVSSEGDDGKSTFLEVGYVFHRSLEYRSGIGDVPLDETVILRSGVRY